MMYQQNICQPGLPVLWKFTWGMVDSVNSE